MSFFSILLALVLEQARPLNPVNFIYSTAERWLAWVARTFDAGVRHQAWITWGITVFGPALLTMLVHWGLQFGLGWLFALRHAGVQAVQPSFHSLTRSLGRR